MDALVLLLQQIVQFLYELVESVRVIFRGDSLAQDMHFLSFVGSHSVCDISKTLGKGKVRQVQFVPVAAPNDFKNVVGCVR
jgi:hypothetical protein